MKKPKKLSPKKARECEPLPARKIVVGSGENFAEVVVDDQELLRLIEEVLK